MDSMCVDGVVSRLRNGLFWIDDRGDSVAEIHVTGDFGELSEQDAAVWAEWDRQLGRSAIEYPIGFKSTSMIIGFVNGLVAAPMDEQGNYTGAHTSAFPGWASIKGVPQQQVATLLELEQYLESNIRYVFNLLIQYSAQSTAQ